MAKPLRLSLGALLIQTQYRFPDEEVPLQIQETSCLQYFCGMLGYEDKLPSDPSLMVYFRKRLTPEIRGEINEIIISEGEQEPAPPSPPDDDAPPNESPSQGFGTLIVDATCAPQNIRYPQDTSLLNEARENLEKMVDELHDPKEGEKPRTYRKKARKDYLKTARKRQRTAKEIRGAIKKQLGYIRRDLDIVNHLLERGKDLSDRHMERLLTIRKLYGQQLCMFKNRTHKMEGRLVSLSQPWVRPIVRGKAKMKCEFGAKPDISVSDGFVRLENTSFDAYNESENLIDIIERYKVRTGHYPARVLAVQIFRSRDNLAFCKKWNIQISGASALYTEACKCE